MLIEQWNFMLCSGCVSLEITRLQTDTAGYKRVNILTFNLMIIEYLQIKHILDLL